jgi:hypothetical protein
MQGLDLFTPRQICDRTRQFQDAMVGTRQQTELTHRCSHQALTISLQIAKLLYFSRTGASTVDISRLLHENQLGLFRRYI